MQLNTLSPQAGAKRPAKRRGRGMASGLGKTCGRGHKGQKARSGGYHKVGFEGGQMPIQRRVPKFGFKSRKSFARAEVRTCCIDKIKAEVVSLATLKAAGLIASHVKYVKIILSKAPKRAFTIENVGITKGARAAIEAAGGKIVEA